MVYVPTAYSKWKNFADVIGDNTPGEVQYFAWSVAKALPFVGSAVTAYDDYRYTRDYLHNTGLSWDDIKYPTRYTSSGVAGLTNFVSHNITKLYR